MMIAVIDYDAGNLGSVVKALRHLGGEAAVTSDSAVIKAASHVILPGVGAFADACGKLRRRGLDRTVGEVAESGRPLLGICLGMQLLFDYSEETFEGETADTYSEGRNAGLGILHGSIRRIPGGELKVPHMGWNSLRVSEGARLFRGLGRSPYVYFVHSYYLQAAELSDVAAVSEYGVTMHVSVEHGNIFGCQFHPEKSGDTGLKILENFISL